MKRSPTLEEGATLTAELLWSGEIMPEHRDSIRDRHKTLEALTRHIVEVRVAGARDDAGMTEPITIIPDDYEATAARMIREATGQQ